jgi:hypothetical protein
VLTPHQPRDPLLELSALLVDLWREGGDPLAPEVVQARSDLYRWLAEDGWLPPPRVRALLHLEEQLRADDLDRWAAAPVAVVVVDADIRRRAELRHRLIDGDRVLLGGEARDPGEAVRVAAYARAQVVVLDAAAEHAAAVADELLAAGGGVAVLTVERGTSADVLLDQLRQIGRPPTPDVLPDPRSADPEAARAAAAAERDLLRVVRPLDATRRLVALVQELGGDLGAPDEDDPSLLALDLSFAHGAPVLPRSDPYSLARLRLELHLPPLVELARRRLRGATP